MGPIQPITGLLPAALRALALGLLVETAETGLAHTLNKSREKSLVPPGPGEGCADGKPELWQVLRYKCDELSALVLGADDSSEAAAYVLGYLPKHLDYVFELVYGQKRDLTGDGRQ